jgi:hypothetical protein
MRNDRKRAIPATNPEKSAGLPGTGVPAEFDGTQPARASGTARGSAKPQPRQNASAPTVTPAQLGHRPPASAGPNVRDVRRVAAAGPVSVPACASGMAAGWAPATEDAKFAGP